MQIVQPPRQERTFDFHCNLIYQRLKISHSEIDWNGDLDLSYMLIFESIKRYDNKEIEEPLLMFEQFIDQELKSKGESYYLNTPVAAIMIACTYLHRARVAKDAGESETAWSFLADSEYWCGIVVTNKGIDKARHKELTSIKTKLSEAGGAKKDEKAYGKTRELAFKLARDRQPASGWQSRSHAVKTILAEVVAFSKTNPDVFSIMDPDNTIDRWLKKMPDAESLFPKRKAAKKTK